MNPNVLWFVVPFCSIFILIGLAFLLTCLRQITAGCRASSWPTTNGRIKTAELIRTKQSKGHTTELKVTYVYTVHDREYVGDVIHPCYSGSSLDPEHKKLAALLKPGKHVEVRYRFDDPQRSMLSTGFYSGTLIGVAIGGLFAAVGTAFLLIFLMAALGDSNFAAGIETIRTDAAK